MDEIILWENNKVGAESEAQENIGFEINKNIYLRLKRILDKKKERNKGQNDVSVRLKEKPKIHMRFKARLV